MLSNIALRDDSKCTAKCEKPVDYHSEQTETTGCPQSKTELFNDRTWPIVLSFIIPCCQASVAS